MADIDAQYAIDIAASMPAGEVTLAQLDELTAKLMGGGKNADHFQRAIVQVSTALDAAKAASVAANEALDAGQTKYRELERAALQASKAAERAAKQNGGVVPAELRVRIGEASIAVDRYAATLARLERESKDAANAENELSRSLTNVRKLSNHANQSLAANAERLSKLRGAIGNVGGPLGRLGQLTLGPVQGFRELSATMGAAGAAATLATVGVAAIAAALLATAAAAAFATIKVVKWAVTLADKEGKLAAETDRLSKNFTALFSGLNIDPVIAGMERLADLFDETSEAGQTIKFLFETIFQPLINQAETAALFVEAFALGFLIGMLKLYIAVKPIIKAVADFLGFETTGLEDTLAAVTTVGQYAAAAFVALVAVFGLLAGAVLAVVAAVAGPFIAAFVAIPVVVNAIIGAVRSVVDYIKSVDFATLGADILRGLASGITSAASVVVNAVRNAISGAIRAAKSMLGISSPSKVFAGLGENTGEGFERGVDATTDDAHEAMRELVSPQAGPVSALAAQDSLSGNLGAAPVASTPAAAPAVAPAGPSVSVQGTFNFYGVKDAEHAQQSFGEVLTRILEGDAAQLGGEVAPA